MTFSLFISSFVFIFLASLPGRTTFLMLMLAAKGNPWVVAGGSALAFAAQSLISVALGTLLAFFSPILVQFLAGTLFLYFALLFWRDSKRKTQTDPSLREKTHSIGSIFLLVFAAEWGDVSQVAIASLSAQSNERTTIFLSAIFALWLIVGIAVIAGIQMGRFTHPKKIQILAAGAFFATGIFMVGKSLLTLL